MRLRHSSKAIQKQRWGGAVLEMAVVLPLFVPMVIGQLEMARMGMVSQLVTTAAREGCRVAVINGKTSSDVQTRVQQTLSTSKITNYTLTITPSNLTTVSGGTPITVAIKVPYTSVSWVPKPLFLGNVNVTASATMSSERP